MKGGQVADDWHRDLAKKKKARRGHDVLAAESQIKNRENECQFDKCEAKERYMPEAEHSASPAVVPSEPVWVVEEQSLHSSRYKAQKDADPGRVKIDSFRTCIRIHERSEGIISQDARQIQYRRSFSMLRWDFVERQESI